MDLIKRVGIRVRELRKLNKLTQAQLAEASDLSDDFIGSLERGITAPSLKTLEKIANALGISLSELLEIQKEHYISVREKDILVKSLVNRLKNIENTSDVKFVASIASHIANHLKKQNR